jgi:ParB-like chromosome segregation protein Spo0J
VTSSTPEPESVAAPLPTIRPVKLARLQPGPTIRPLDEAHVLVLRGVLDRLPPIAVTEDDLMLIDGAHRVEAAVRARLTHLPAEHLALAPGEVLAERVRRNASHGLPLRLEERKRAALLLIAEDPTRSNAAVGRTAGLSTSTVRRLRGCPGRSENDLDTVTGVDGNNYPRNPDDRRRAALDLLRREPGLSDRAIARQVRLSPTTVGALRRTVESSRLRRLLESLLRHISDWILRRRPRT